MFNSKHKNSSARQRSSSNTDSSFRRNNIVISSSQRALKEHQQSVSQRQTDAVDRRRRALFKRRTSAVIICAILVLCALRLQITQVSIVQSKDSTVSLTTGQQDAYGALINRYIGEHVLLRQSWLLDSSDLTRYVQKDSPEVSSVALRSRNPFSTTATANLEFRKPQLLYKGIGHTQFIDNQGVIFGNNRYKNVPMQTLPIVEDQGGTAPAVGQTVLSRPIIVDIAQIYTKLPLLYPPKTRVSGIVLPRTSREIQAKIGGQKYYIKFSSERRIADQIGELRQLLSYLSRNNITPSEYIDVRVENKVFYK